MNGFEKGRSDDELPLKNDEGEIDAEEAEKLGAKELFDLMIPIREELTELEKTHLDLRSVIYTGKIERGLVVKNTNELIIAHEIPKKKRMIIFKGRGIYWKEIREFSTKEEGDKEVGFENIDEGMITLEDARIRKMISQEMFEFLKSNGFDFIKESPKKDKSGKKQFIAKMVGDKIIKYCEGNEIGPLAVWPKIHSGEKESNG